MRKRDITLIARYGIGPCRADFAITDARLVVECDGPQGHEASRDQQRDAALRCGTFNWELEGDVAADLWERYVGYSVGKGGQNPIRYVNA